MSDPLPPTEKLPVSEPLPTGEVTTPKSGNTLLVILIAAGALLLVAVAVGITLLLTSGRESTAGPAPADSPSESPAASESPTPTAPPPPVEDDEDAPPPVPPAPSGSIDSIVVTVFDGDGMTPQEICTAWNTPPTNGAGYTNDTFNVAVNWDSSGGVDRVDVVSSDGGSWPAKAEKDVIFAPFECWSGPSQARQLTITLQAYAAGQVVDSAVVTVKSNAAVQIQN